MTSLHGLEADASGSWDAGGLATAEQALVFGDTLDWEPLDLALMTPWLGRDPRYATALATRGVAYLTSERGTDAVPMTAKWCSGFLIGPGILATARHCVSDYDRDRDPDTRDPTDRVLATFGRRLSMDQAIGMKSMGVALADPASHSGLQFMIHRLVELGIPYDAVKDATPELLTHSCEFIAYENAYSDIAYFECEPVVFAWDRHVREVYPGEIWGFTPIQQGRPGKNVELTGGFINAYRRDGRVSDETASQQVSFAGTVVDGDPLLCNGDWHNCFHHRVDTRCGASGGLLLRDDNLRAQGVNSGFILSGFSLTPPDHCEWSTQSTNWANTGAPFGAWGERLSGKTGADAVEAEDLFKPEELPVSDSYTGDLAGHVPVPEIPVTGAAALCPENMFVAGVLVTEQKPGATPEIGNVALACMPYNREQALPLSYSTVVMTGTGVNHRREDGASYEYWWFRNAVLSDHPLLHYWANADRTHSELLCAPGEYLESITLGVSGSTLRAVVGGTCRTFDGSDGTGTRKFPEPLGDDTFASEFTLGRRGSLMTGVRFGVFDDLGTLAWVQPLLGTIER